MNTWKMPSNRTVAKKAIVRSQGAPQSTQVQKRVPGVRMLEETAAQTVVGSIVWAFRRLKKPRSREMSARSYALHSVCLNFPSFFSTSQLAAVNAAAEDSYKQTMAACPNCGRTFLPERLTVHLRACRPKTGPAAKRGSPGKAGPPSSRRSSVEKKDVQFSGPVDSRGQSTKVRISKQKF